MKLLKKNQIVIYAIAVLLMVAGYLNYSTNTEHSLQASSQDINATSEIANTGDARLVSSNAISENSTENNEQNSEESSQQNGSKEGENNKIEETNSSILNSVSSNSNATNSNTAEASSNVSDDYFTKSKLERDTMYSQMLETYEKVLNSTNSLETQKQSATQEITKINDTKNSIMVSENLLQTKGFNNAVIFVNGDSVSVIIGKDELKQEEVAQIQNIISREMKAKIENIHISTK